MNDYAIVIPARNEEDAIGFTVAELLREAKTRGLQLRVIVVDDGSTDKTAEHAASAGALVVRQVPQGKGAALRRGILSCTANTVAWCDADAPVSAFAVIDFTIRADLGATLLSGRRVSVNPASGRFIRRLLSGLIRRAWCLTTSSPVQDPFCPLKAAPTFEARAVAMRCKAAGYVFDAEFVLEWQRGNSEIAQSDVPWTDLRGHITASHLVGSVREWTTYIVRSRRSGSKLLSSSSVS